MSNINRRGFLSFLGLGAAAVVARQTEPRDLVPAEAEKVVYAHKASAFQSETAFSAVGRFATERSAGAWSHAEYQRDMILEGNEEALVHYVDDK